MRKLPFLLWGGTILFLHVPCQAGTIPLTYQQKCIHLLNRLTFGPKPGDLERVRKMGTKAFIEEQLNPEGIDNSQCEMELVSYPTLKMSSYELFQAYPPPQFVFNNANSTVDARYVPEDEMAVYPGMMAMMENRAGKPKQSAGLNENYARELMELHTLGVDGGYSQQDVIQVARALTGWSFQGPYFLLQPGRGRKRIDPESIFTFQFHPRMHDLGEKVILAQT